MNRYVLAVSTCLAALAIALAATVAAVSSQDGPNSGRMFITAKSWDTDNLRYVSDGSVIVSARNFRVPFHVYTGYKTAAGSGSAKTACRGGGVTDAFFQTDSTGRNDFPVLKKFGLQAHTAADTACGSGSGSGGLAWRSDPYLARTDNHPYKTGGKIALSFCEKVESRC